MNLRPFFKSETSSILDMLDVIKGRVTQASVPVANDIDLLVLFTTRTQMPRYSVTRMQDA